jgi:hypothetical protein
LTSPLRSFRFRRTILKTPRSDVRARPAPATRTPGSGSDDRCAQAKRARRAESLTSPHRSFRFRRTILKTPRSDVRAGPQRPRRLRVLGSRRDDPDGLGRLRRRPPDLRASEPRDDRSQLTTIDGVEQRASVKQHVMADDQTPLGEQPKLATYGRPAHLEPSGQIGRSMRPDREERDDPSPGWIGKKRDS